MKLQNKETGEIRKGEAREDGIYLYDEITGQWYKYELDLLASGWKYYEEPKERYFISEFGTVEKTPSNTRETIYDKARKHFGNYFETKEEAEKAVEKLKAWKRLKDEGFEFESWFGGSKDISFWLDTEIDEDIAKDLDLLFGGEE